MDNKYIGILTSGGDASGMNAAIRAVTRAAIFNGFKVKGIYRGYEGLIAGEVKELTTEDVSSIIQRGGTILKTARSETFTTPEGRKKAYKVIQKENINALIIIGGDGSLTGARIFAEEYDVTCIGLPGTIDNDLYGTDFTIGYIGPLFHSYSVPEACRNASRSAARSFQPESSLYPAGPRHSSTFLRHVSSKKCKLPQKKIQPPVMHRLPCRLLQLLSRLNPRPSIQ